MSSAVAEGDEIYEFLVKVASIQLKLAEELNVVEPEDETETLARKILEEKAVYRLGWDIGTTQRMFVALHKVKVKSAKYVECEICSRGPNPGLRFGTLTLTLDQQRQRFEDVKVGIIDAREEVWDTEYTEALVQWALRNHM